LRRRGRVMLFSLLAALVGGAALFGSIAWFLWQESVAAEQAYNVGLANSLGERTEEIFLDTRDLLDRFNKLQATPCSREHLQAMQDAAMARPYIRAIGYWQETERLCSVGFHQGLKPPRADRIYGNGVVAWWPSAQTRVGGVELFLMRYGEHDVAIDPRLLLDLGPNTKRQAALWVEGLPMAQVPAGAKLPPPAQVKVGVHVDRARGVVLSRFSRNALMPIDVVAMEPIDSFWGRHSQSLALGAGLGMALVLAWIFMILRFSRYQLSLATELREALAAGRIEVQYQPVVELPGGRCVGAEALARWQRENGESVSPDVFIPIAEEVGLVQDVTRAVLRTVVDDIKPMLAEFPGLSINVNLAPDDLKNAAFGEELASILDEARLAAGAIKLEITERALVNNDTSRALIRHFRKLGHQVAVDDFGTGYSSLSYLQSFELDVLKIDKVFVDAIGTEAATSQVIVHVIEMAKSLGLDCVAEGVETPAQKDWLAEHGVAYGQGYLFSVALPVERFVEYVRANRRPGP
jgi:sensor c-di-GMP phosphodiesterase-like protein